jgi:hypothetical protein
VTITVHLKDGSVREFPHEYRAGGSYGKTIRYEGMFVIIRDEWDKETAFPASDVKEVISEPQRRF